MLPRWLRGFSAAWTVLLGWSVLRGIVRAIASRAAHPGQPHDRGRPPAQVRPTQQQVPSASHPPQIISDSAPATRKRVVLLPHVPIEPTDTRPDQRRTPEGPLA